jgi:hypothetical protein
VFITGGPGYRVSDAVIRHELKHSEQWAAGPAMPLTYFYFQGYSALWHAVGVDNYWCTPSAWGCSNPWEVAADLEDGGYVSIPETINAPGSSGGLSFNV